MARVTWDGGAGSWDDPFQWTPERVPTPGDTADLPSGIVHINGVDASNITIIDDWIPPTIDQDATLDVSDSIIGNVIIAGGNPVTPHGVGTSTFNIGGGVLFDGTISASGIEGGVLDINLGPGAILVNQGDLALDNEDVGSIIIAMSSGAVVVNEGEIHGGNGLQGVYIGGSFSDALVNDGTISTGSIATIGAAVLGTGEFVGGSGSAEFMGYVGSGQNYVFEPLSTSTLKLDQPGEFFGTIVNFAEGETIELAGVSATASSYQNGSLTVLDGAAPVAMLRLNGTYADGDFGIAANGHGGTDVTRL